MAGHTSLGRIWLAVMVGLSLPDSSRQLRDPKKDFCRRFGHQTALVDRRLYIDGGFINYKPMKTDPMNYTNTWLAYHDLDDVHRGMPNIYFGLGKNASIPSVHGGALWADSVNYRLYLYGGEFASSSPTAFNLLSYDIWYDQWDNFGQVDAGIQRTSYGAGVGVSERGEGYYYGGYLSNASVPGWAGPPLATSGMIRYGMDDRSWANFSGPDDIGRAEGVMTFIPASDSGMLVYFGGVQDPYHNGTLLPQPLSQIFIYDVVSTKWHVQIATGTIPESRRKFCAGAVWAKDRSSYNIYLNAGQCFDGPGWDDVYILSIPSFTWIKIYPLDRNGTGQFPSHSLSCNIVNDSQMLAIGGTFPLDPDGCDYEQNWAVHNIDLGGVIEDRWQDVWAGYQKDLQGYQVPHFVSNVIGGDQDGGATRTVPQEGFGNPDLGPLLAMTAEFQSRERAADGRTAPPATSGDSDDSSGGLSAGAVAGIVVAGAVVAVFLLLALWMFWRKRKSTHRHQPVEMSGSPLSPYAPVTYYHDSGSNAAVMTPGHINHLPAGGTYPGYGYSPGHQHHPSRPNWSWSTTPTNSPPVPATSILSPAAARPTAEMDGNIYGPVELDVRTPTARPAGGATKTGVCGDGAEQLGDVVSGNWPGIHGNLSTGPGANVNDQGRLVKSAPEIMGGS